jgi:hypothetical protein
VLVGKLLRGLPDASGGSFQHPQQNLWIGGGGIEEAGARQLEGHNIGRGRHRCASGAGVKERDFSEEITRPELGDGATTS